MDKKKVPQFEQDGAAAQPAPEFRIRTEEFRLGRQALDLSVVFRMEVPEITGSHHDFVVAREDMDPPTLFPGGSFKGPQKPKDFRDIGTPIHSIANYHKMALPEGPSEPIVDHLLGLQQLQQRIEAAMDIADRQDLFGGRENRLGRKRIYRLQGDGVGSYPRQGQGKRSGGFLHFHPSPANPQNTGVGTIPKHMGAIVERKGSDLHIGRGKG